MEHSQLIGALLISAGLAAMAVGFVTDRLLILSPAAGVVIAGVALVLMCDPR